MFDTIIEYFWKLIDTIKWSALIVGILGFIFKMIGKYIAKKFKEFETLRDEVKDIAQNVELLDYKAEGRKSFTDTVVDHEVRISVLEQLEKRKQNLPIDFPDRRKNKRGKKE